MHDLKVGYKFYGGDGAHVLILCVGCLSWNGHSFRICISKEEDGAFQAGMIAGGLWRWDRIVVGGSTYVHIFRIMTITLLIGNLLLSRNVGKIALNSPSTLSKGLKSNDIVIDL